MYWPLRPPVKQEFSNFDLDLIFIVITCVLLHTVIIPLLNNSSNYHFCWEPYISIKWHVTGHKEKMNSLGFHIYIQVGF